MLRKTQLAVRTTHALQHSSVCAHTSSGHTSSTHTPTAPPLHAHTNAHTSTHTRAHTQAHQEGFQRLQTGGSGSGGHVRAIAHGALEEGEGSKPQSVLEGEVRDEGCQAPAEHRARTTPSSSSTAAAITAAAAAAAKSQGPQPDVGVGMGDAQHCNCNLSWFLKCGTDDKPQTGTWQQQQQRPASTDATVCSYL